MRKSHCLGEDGEGFFTSAQKQCLCKISGDKQRVLWYFSKWPIFKLFITHKKLIKNSVNKYLIVPGKSLRDHKDARQGDSNAQVKKNFCSWTFDCSPKHQRDSNCYKDSDQGDRASDN